MSTLNIKPTHKPIKTYYAELKEYERLGEQNEGTVRAAFQGLLQHYCHQSNLTLLCEKTRAFPPDKGGQGGSNRRIRPDGFEDDMHPIIRAYLVEVLHDSSSFRLERFDYTLANYPSMIPDKKRTILPSKSPKVLYKQVLIPAYHINMLFWHKVPTSCLQLEEMRFYLLKDKQLILPNNLAVSLIE